MVETGQPSLVCFQEGYDQSSFKLVLMLHHVNSLSIATVCIALTLLIG